MKVGGGAALNLDPWETPPSCGLGHDPKADRPLRKMLAARISRFEPFPAAALRAVQARVGANFALRPAVRVETHEQDARAGIGRMECDGNRKARVDADTRDRRTRPERGLSARFHVPVPQPLGDRTARRGPLVTGIALHADSWNLLCCFAGIAEAPPLDHPRPAAVPYAPEHEKA